MKKSVSQIYSLRWKDIKFLMFQVYLILDKVIMQKVILISA